MMVYVMGYQFLSIFICENLCPNQTNPMEGDSEKMTGKETKN
jgi:hypothetical protein